MPYPSQSIVLPIIEDLSLAMVDRFSASRFWNQVRTYGATPIHYLGGILQILLKQPESKGDREHPVRVARGGGCPKEVWPLFKERFGIDMRECYGMTEASSITTCNATGVVGAVGQPMPWFSVDILDEKGEPVPTGGRGEIVVRTSLEGALHTGDSGSFAQHRRCRRVRTHAEPADHEASVACRTRRLLGPTGAAIGLACFGPSARMKGSDGMDQSGEIVLVGCGNMGFALLEGWVARFGIAADRIHVVEPVEALRRRAVAAGAAAYADASELPQALQPRAFIVAVKPQVIGSMLATYRRFSATAAFVSIAAGVPIATFEATLGAVPIVRAMPNMPASIGMGVIAAFANAHTGNVQMAYVSDLLAAVGNVHWLPEEELINAATAISGSGPAYLFHFIECLTEAGIAVGLPVETAHALAKQTVDGASTLASASVFSPTELRQQVTSPNGTTAAALEVLMAEPSLAALLREAAAAAHQRALELAVVG